MKSERNRNAEKALLSEGGKLSQDDQAAKNAEIKQRAAAAKVASSGLDSRVKGHVTVQTRRNQGKRDAKNG